MAERENFSEREDLPTSRGSLSPSNSDLLKRTQQNDDFRELEEKAKKERNKLSSMLEAFRNSSNEDQTTTVDEDYYTDADDFIINKGDSPFAKSSKRSSKIIKEEEIPTVEISDPELTGSSSERVTKNNKSDVSLNSFEFEKPQPIIPQDANVTLHSNTSSLSFNRHSMISDYTPSIHEVNKVQYVVDYNVLPENSEVFPDKKVVINPKKDEDTSVIGSRKPSVIKIRKGSVKSVRTSSGEYCSSGHSNTASISSSAPSRRSLLGVEPEHKKNVSYDSSVMSTSGSFKHNGKDYQLGDSKVLIPNIVEEQKNQSQESFSFNIGPLHTEKKLDSPKEADRLATTNLSDAIPSRSPNRPVSMLSSLSNKEKHADDQLSDLMYEIDDEIAKSPLQQHNELGELTNNAAGSTPKAANEINEDIKVLPKEHVFSTVPQGEKHSHERNESNQSNTIPRPLPPPPLPKHESKPSEDKSAIADDDYVTEDEVDESGKTSKKEKKHKKRNSREKKKRISSSFKKGYLNHETLVQLLQVTEGTIIGQEFQNIGLQTTEKQLLERLVDSLSRLTADMVIDSERHDESVKRLNKAIRALEGF